MKAVHIKSRVNGMIEWAIKDDIGKLHIVDKDCQGHLRCVELPELLHFDIARMVNNARKNSARSARDEAYRSCGLTKVKGALGGTYWE